VLETYPLLIKSEFKTVIKITQQPSPRWLQNLQTMKKAQTKVKQP